jgi:hypothetical protein
MKKVWEYGSMGVWEYGSELTVEVIHSNFIGNKDIC